MDRPVRASPRRRAIPTRAGLFILLTPVFLGVAAVSSANNLLFIMVGGALGAIVLSGVLSERNIRGVTARVEQIGPAYAGEPARMRVILRRPDLGYVAYGLRFRERRRLWDRFRRRGKRGATLNVMVPVLEGRTADVFGVRTFTRRGPATLPLCELVTTYPFSLLHKSRDVLADVRVIVRPRRVEVPSVLRDPSAIDADGESSSRRGVGLDVYGLRERREADALHRIHALRSLSMGQDVVVETTGADRPTAHLGIVNDERADPESLERAIEIAAAALSEWDRRGYAIGLSTAAQQLLPGEVSLERVLDTLAQLTTEAPATRRTEYAAVWLVPEGAAARGHPLHVGQEGLR